MPKPKDILEIEKNLKISFEHAKSLSDTHQKSNYYIVNEIAEIIGLKISEAIEDLNILSNLLQLRHLDLRNNFISNLETLSSFHQLESLDISYNNIQNITPLSSLLKLRELYIRNNKVTDLKPVSDLSQLIILDCSDNTIKELNNVDLSRTFIIFRNNLITRLKFDFFLPRDPQNNFDLLNYVKFQKALFVYKQDYENAARLRDLEKKLEKDCLNNISKTKESDLLEFQNTEKKLFVFYYEYATTGNEIVAPPKEVVIDGIDSVRRYFERAASQLQSFIYEAKVTFVGEGSSGKTSLQRRIVDAKSPLPKEEERTRGIDVIEYNFSNYKAHIWDFGGQDVYYPVHRFFLTNDSVYVLVASTRTNIHNFDYWIPTIFQFGGSSPIILTQNKFDGNPANWDNLLSYYYSKSEYNLLKPYYTINLINNNEGLTNLKEILETTIKGLPHIKKEIPTSWLDVRARITKVRETKSIISFGQLIDICKEVDRINHTSNFNEDIDIIDLAKFFSKLGIIHWFDKNDILRQNIVLKPEWLMSGIYSVLDDKILVENGFITLSDFERIWKSAEYRNQHVFLKNVLKEFKIAFPKKHQPNEFILPSRTKTIPDENRWQADARLLKMIYSFDFIPYGLVNQISAELSRFLTSDINVWYNAVNLEYENNAAQIEEDRHNRKISILCKGENARDLFAIIRKSIEDIISEYRGVQYEIIVPCNCQKCITISEPTLFNYNKIKKWIDEGSQFKFCNESDEKINLKDLIYKVGIKYESAKELGINAQEAATTNYNFFGSVSASAIGTGSIKSESVSEKPKTTMTAPEIKLVKRWKNRAVLYLIIGVIISSIILWFYIVEPDIIPSADWNKIKTSDAFEILKYIFLSIWVYLIYKLVYERFFDPSKENAYIDLMRKKY